MPKTGTAASFLACTFALVLGLSCLPLLLLRKSIFFFSTP
jgi:hypothetical protein